MPIMRNAVMLGTKKYSPPRVSTNCGMPSTMNGGWPDAGSAGITNLALGPALSSGAPLIATQLAFRGLGIDVAGLANVTVADDSPAFAAALRLAYANGHLAGGANQQCAATGRIYEQRFAFEAYRKSLWAIVSASEYLNKNLFAQVRLHSHSTTKCFGNCVPPQNGFSSPAARRRPAFVKSGFRIAGSTARLM